MTHYIKYCTQCENHYDGDKFYECPHCNNANEVSRPNKAGIVKTGYKGKSSGISGPTLDCILSVIFSIIIIIVLVIITNH